VLEKKLEKSPKVDSCFLYERIEALTGSGLKYHDMNAEANMEDVMIYLMSDLQKLIRYFNTVNSTEALIETLLTKRSLKQYEATLLYLIRTNKMHKMPEYASKLYDMKPVLDNRWVKFETKVNDILSSEGIDKKLQDYLVDC